jgi:hypothetical protein
LEGNRLALLAPRVKGEKNPKHLPKVAEHIGSDKIDNGWGNVKDKKIEKELRRHIADENKGKGPKTEKANLPPDVAEKIKKHHGGKFEDKKAKKGATPESRAAGGEGSGSFDQHPHGKGKHERGDTGTGPNGASNQTNITTGIDRHPGTKRHKGRSLNAGQNEQGGKLKHGKGQQIQPNHQQQQELYLQQQKNKKNKGTSSPEPL